MSELQHTPGPWSVPHFARDDHSCDCHFVFSDWQRGMGSIATVNSQSQKKEGAEENEPVELAKGNARLIAAAPDLLEACMAFVDYDECEESSGIAMMAAYNDAITKARAALTRLGGAS